MKTRIIASAVLIPVLFLLVLVAPTIVASVVFGLLLAIGVYELLFRTGLIRQFRLVVYSALTAFLLSIWSNFGSTHAYLMGILALLFVLLFSEIMMNHVKIRLEMLTLCFFAGFVVPYLLTALIRILVTNVGRYMILIPFIIAFMSDAGAYFIGIRFGRHKLAPVISPNKTIEGLFGGVGFAVVGVLVYAIIMQFAFDFRVNYGLAILYALVGSGVGVFGDLCFSAIKRQTGIKDYGNLIPGHGGFLDRFDSLVLVAPVIEAMLQLWPMAV